MIRAAVYGLGRWGQRLTESIADSDRIRVTMGITRDPARHEGFARNSGVTLTTSYAAALRDPQVDAVILATPHSQHRTQIIQAARAEKHVFVEKPFTLTRKSAEQALDACREAGITLGVGFNRRHAPAFVEMMRRIEGGEIGEILHVEGQNSGPTGHSLVPGTWRANRKEAPAGGMTARGVHALDCMIRIAGHVATVYCSSERRTLDPAVEIDDTTAALFRFANGASGCLTSVFVTGDYWRVQAVGSKGWLEARSETELSARGLHGAVQTVRLEHVDKERAELEAFADAIAAGERFVVPPGDIVNGVAVLEAMVKSAANGKPVNII